MISAAQRAGMELDGPHSAVLVRGDDELGALAGIHQDIFRTGVNVYASSELLVGATVERACSG